MNQYQYNENTLQRKLPANVQAEQMLLGAILINCELLNHINDFLMPEHFSEEIHRKIYKAINILSEKNIIANAITVKTMIANEEVSRIIEPEKYLHGLTIMAMLVINVMDYARVIYDLSLKRSLIQIGEEVVNKAYDPSFAHQAIDQLEEAESSLYRLANEGVTDKSFVPVGTSLKASIASIDRAMKSDSHITGIPTNLMELDKKLSGFQNSDLVIIAARPGMGKTAFAINFALTACKELAQKALLAGEKPKGVGFFSMEMSSEQISTRILSCLAKIDSADLRSGKNITEETYNRLRNTATEINEMPFFIDDTAALSLASLRVRARKLQRKHGIGILFIDYLQLIRVPDNNNRVMEVSEITRGLKAIAKELNIPLIALSQLSRAVEQREDKRPSLSDLRDSGSIEQDADIVMFLYREEYYLSRKEPLPGDPKYFEWVEKMAAFNQVAEIIVAKHRNGSTGSIPLHYMVEYSRINNLTQEQKEKMKSLGTGGRK